jgi:hypothetical protein
MKILIASTDGNGRLARPTERSEAPGITPK